MNELNFTSVTPDSPQSGHCYRIDNKVTVYSARKILLLVRGYGDVVSLLSSQHVDVGSFHRVDVSVYVL